MAKAFLERDYESIVAKKAPAKPPTTAEPDSKNYDDNVDKKAPAEPPKTAEPDLEIVETRKEPKEEPDPNKNDAKTEESSPEVVEIKPEVISIPQSPSVGNNTDNVKKENAETKLYNTNAEEQPVQLETGTGNAFDSMLDNADGVGRNEFDLHLDGDLGNQDFQVNQLDSNLHDGSSNDDGKELQQTADTQPENMQVDSNFDDLLMNNETFGGNDTENQGVPEGDQTMNTSGELGDEWFTSQGI